MSSSGHLKVFNTLETLQENQQLAMSSLNYFAHVKYGQVSEKKEFLPPTPPFWKGKDEILTIKLSQFSIR